ncbi:MAG: S-layer homology domain-containing protein [Clostridiales bacterium]|nr:S-layer homology domain-containing protein [Clostridiales bacterium]
MKLKLNFKRLARSAAAITFSCMILAGTNTVSGASFTDTQNHWAKDAIEKYATQGLISTDTSEFRPDDPVTLAELVTILNKFFKVTAPVRASGQWYQTQLGAAQSRGYLNAFGGNLDPDQSVNHLQYYLMTYNLLGEPEWNNIALLDAYSNELGAVSGNTQYEKAVAYLAANSLNSEFSDGKLHLYDNLTRAELISTLNKIEKRAIALSIVVGSDSTPMPFRSDNLNRGSAGLTRINPVPEDSLSTAAPSRSSDTDLSSPSRRTRERGTSYGDDSGVSFPLTPGSKYGVDRPGRRPSSPSRDNTDSVESAQPPNDTADTPQTLPGEYDDQTNNRDSSSAVTLPGEGVPVLPPQPSAEPNGVSDFFFDLKTNTWEPIK